jgi:hypothetical protein
MDFAEVNYPLAVVNIRSLLLSNHPFFFLKENYLELSFLAFVLLVFIAVIIYKRVREQKPKQA